MNTDHEPLVQMILSCLDGRATEAEAFRLNARLREDAAARDLYLQLADTHSCLSVDESLWVDPSFTATASDRRAHAGPKRWFSGRPLTAAAAGIVLGMLCTSVVFAYVAPALGRTKTIFAESFESDTSTAPELPRETGRWGGDEAVGVQASAEVKPRSGNRMLRFLSGTHQGENSPRSQWGDVYRFVDVRGLVGAGHTVARLSASFSQGPGVVANQFSCSVEALALDEQMSSLPSPLNYVWLRQNSSAYGARMRALPADGGWQDMSVEVPVTSRTQFVLLHLAVIQNAPVLQTGAVSFPGQYMDDVKVELLTRP
jgi:hypothetical protein